MDIKKDIEEARVNWRQWPWLLKVWVLLSMFFTVSSVASLADAVAQWKGFFLDAVLFYRQWISVPFQSSLAHFDLQYKQKNADFLLICFVVITFHFRAMWINSMSYDENSRRGIRITSFFYCIEFCILLVNILKIPGPSIGWMNMTILAATFLVSPLVVVSTHYVKIFVLQFLFSVLIVSVMAAINAGLHR